MRLRPVAFAGLSLTLVGLSLGATVPAHAQPEAVRLTVIGTTDVHGHIYPTSYFGKTADEDLGLAKCYTLIQQLRAQNPHTVLVDSGDALQGSPLTYWHARIAKPGIPNPMIAVMNKMGYVAFGVGNHEYNFGLPYLFQARKEASFPFVSANTYRAGTDTTAYEPYTMTTVAGVKVGIIGFTPPGVAIWDKANVQGKLEFRDILASAKLWVPKLKAAGADVIVAVPHSGLGGTFGPAYTGYSATSGLPPENVAAELATRFPELNVVFPGHTHTEVPGTHIGNAAVCQAQKWGERLSVADLQLEKVDGHWQVVKTEARVLTTVGVKPSPDVMMWAKAAHEATTAYVQSSLATTPDVWSTRESMVADTPIIDFINAVQTKATNAHLSAAAAFTSDADIKGGRITVADMAAVYPYENALVAIKITGKQLREYLEFSAHLFAPYQAGKPAFNPEVRGYNYDMVSGCNYDIDVRKPVGQRIQRLSYKGKPITDGQLFTLALNSYRQRGGGGYEMLKNAPIVYNREESIRDLMIDYLKVKKHLAIKDVFVKNWQLLPTAPLAADGKTYAAKP
ncbi:MAG: 5'-nucleotidase C-terminal domain-containing protein [Candidatus Sericytochromatia bacterium]|nr:5'-nucleotidase C-terminal domain-containing protein [Candidatus Sericytochromatia bacterium]